MGKRTKKIVGKERKAFVQLKLPSEYLNHPLYEGAKYWSDGTYDVVEIVYAPEVTWLSIKRRDKEWIHDWRDLQRIKGEICGPEREAFELYPAESRLNDTANQYHLWVLAEGMLMPVGYTDRSVLDGTVPKPGSAFGKSGQRPLPEGTQVTETEGQQVTELYDGKLSRTMRLRCRTCWQMVPKPQPVPDVIESALAVIEAVDIPRGEPGERGLSDDDPLWVAIVQLQKAAAAVFDRNVSRETSTGEHDE